MGLIIMPEKKQAPWMCIKDIKHMTLFFRLASYKGLFSVNMLILFFENSQSHRLPIGGARSATRRNEFNPIN